MLLVSIIVLLLLDRLLEAKTDWRQRHAPEWYFRRGLTATAAGLPVSLARILLWLVPVGLIALVDQLAPVEWGWVFAVIVLLLVIAPRHSQRINRELEQGCAAEDTALVQQARRVLFLDSRYPAGTLNARTTGQRLVLLGFSEWFAVLFWFVLLGPAAAVLYRLTEWSARIRLDSEQKPGWVLALQRGLLGVLTLPPALLFAVLLMLAGSFQNGLRAWRRDYHAGFRHGAHARLEAYALGLLARVGDSAVETEQQDTALDKTASLSEQRLWYRAAQAVQLRAQWFGLGLLALLMLAGWL